MELNIVNEVAALRRLSVAQLRLHFAELFGEATNASNRIWLTKRILWRMQALAEGDLSQRARQRAAQLARDADLRLNAPQQNATTTTPAPMTANIPAPIDPRLPPPGTILTRPYKGQLIQVQVLTEGFRLCRPDLSLAQRRGQKHHRQPHPGLSLFPQQPQPQQGDNMNHNSKKSAATLPLVPCASYTRNSTQASKQPCPTDPTSVWNQSKRILFAVAHKVRRAMHLKLDGHGHAELETEELVHDAFLAVMEALPRFHPATAQFTTFVYGLARRRMWLVARAGFYGVSIEQMHRMDTAKRTPRYHHKDSCLRLTPASTADPQERPSVRLVASIRHRLAPADRRWLDLYLQEGGNYAAVARRLGRAPERVRGRYCCLFRRIRATV